MPRKDEEQEQKNDSVQLVTENQLINAKLDHIISLLEKD